MGVIGATVLKIDFLVFVVSLVGASDNRENTGLTEIPTDVSSGESTLYLGSNSITSVPDDSFSTLSNLVTLSLRFNSISYVGRRAWRELGKLTSLSLESNKVTSLELLVDDVPLLRTLNLDHNKLTEMPKLNGIFTNLGFYYLNNNSISYIDPDYFLNATGMIHLFLNNNKLKQFESNVGFSSTLKTLKIEDNQLTEMPKLPGVYQNPGTTIYLANNNISLDAFLTYAPNFNLLNILVLDLSGNQDFARNISAVILYLKENDQKMKRLVFKSMGFTKVPDTLGLSIILDVGNNNISSISSEEWDRIGHNLKGLDIADNPINRLPNLNPYLDGGTLFSVNIGGGNLFCDDLCWILVDRPDFEYTYFYDDAFGATYAEHRPDLYLSFGKAPCQYPPSAVGVDLKFFLPSYCPAPCDSSPCLYGGTCSNIELASNTYGFKCECTGGVDGYGVGDRCEPENWYKETSSSSGSALMKVSKFSIILLDLGIQLTTVNIEDIDSSKNPHLECGVNCFKTSCLGYQIIDGTTCVIFY